MSYTAKADGCAVIKEGMGGVLKETLEGNMALMRLLSANLKKKILTKKAGEDNVQKN